MTTLAALLKEKVLLLDGAMGTQILAHKPTLEDFGGAAYEGCLELLNERRPAWIRDIHAGYFAAGADAVETNTFGCNEIVLAEFGLAHRTEELNEISVRIAREVARDFSGPRFVIGSVGPGTRLPTLGHVDIPTLQRSYQAQMRGLLRGGADAILIETCQDLGQIKTALRAAKAAMAELGRRVPIWVQATVESTGTLLLGSEIAAVLTSVEMLGIDVLGLNCATGPDEMHPHLQVLAEQSPFAISCLPNAGLPLNEGGRTVYPLGPEAFAGKVAGVAKEFNLNVVGGCCGTTPDHIRALRESVDRLTVIHRNPSVQRSVASLYQSVPLRQDPAPLIVGERTNANGSRLFRDLLAKEDYDGLVGIARDQQREGAHMLDVCVAYVGRDESRDMMEFLKRAVTQVTLPLMIDSTEIPVIETALRAAPGKCLVNSINFEDGEAKARRVLDLCREYGAGIVALTIDEQGMAHSADRKLEVAERLVRLVVDEYGFDPGDLILDPLTFTLGSGDESFRRSAVETLDAIARIKARWPGVRTILGVSNVSFGLLPACRHVVNALMLYHGVKAGLDLAIFNSSKVIPVAKIPAEQRRVVEDLLFDRRAEGYDPLKVALALFQDIKLRQSEPIDEVLTIEERLKRDILDGEKQRVAADVDEALRTLPPLEIINIHLLGAMRVVGERFGAGEMQLPFVLESAETMKAAIQRLEPHLPKEADNAKGRILLATVKGDVHDIGKNLVDIILTNNGYEVKNLGIKQPIERILAELKDWPADAIGLSGLLVKSTVIMKEALEHMEDQGLGIPVILGGAALTRDYVERDCRQVYRGPVLYAEDAFEGLGYMDAIAKGTLDASGHGPRQAPAVKILRRGVSSVTLAETGRSGWVRPQESVPQPPFWGIRTVGHPMQEIFAFLDHFVVIRNRWSFTQGSLDDATFETLIQEKAEPLLDAWKRRLLEEPLLDPKCRYGYLPAQARGEVLRVFSPDRTALLAEIPFPRQAGGRRLCIPDFFASESEGRFDVLGLQIVTMGQRAAERAAELYAADRYADYFHFHGLATELTEAYAELVHAQIRRELGVDARDAKELRQLFSQGYQGSRYSFGYPACPDLEGNAVLLDLLGGAKIGVALTEGFQMTPEFTTSALVAWHPQARYFSA
jgi:5-methyltetrahydrofolate--homocysteine methyltransferase